jgi:hypothetical protein
MKAPSPSSQLTAFINCYPPEMARAFKAARKKMRTLIPRGYELVYDNYNGLGIGYGPNERSPGAVISILAYPRWITLFFLYGARLDDPKRLLEGSGSRVRSIRLKSPDDLDDPDIKLLLLQALSPYIDAFKQCSKLTLLIKAIAKKRLPRESGKSVSTKKSLSIKVFA